jgi:hypothetical protein
MVLDYKVRPKKFMNNPSLFILKLIILSALLSILIKYGGPLLSIPVQYSLMIVLAPSLILALIFGWRLSHD